MEEVGGVCGVEDGVMREGAAFDPEETFTATTLNVRVR
jgi:hypothetical protein